MLKWRTPLDGLRSNCLTVTSNGKKLQYDGIYLKRSAPGPNQYLLVKAGQTVSSTFDVSDAYDMTKTGLYSIAVDTYLEYVKDSVTEKPVSQTKIEHLLSPVVSYEIDKMNFIKGTTGQRARTEESVTKDALEDHIFYVKRGQDLKASLKYKIKGGSPDVKRETELAIVAVYNYVQSAGQDLVNNPPRTKTWFGSSPTDKPKWVFDKMERVLSKDRFAYIIGGRECDEDTYAYTTFGARRMFLCNLYSIADPLIGYDTKLGIIIHELSHAVARRDDIVYGQYDCKQLAIKDPKAARDNADNYEYFVESGTISSL